MGITDPITSWYIKNILLPKSEKIDVPGFILTEIGEGANKTYLREIAIPEEIFVNLEKQVEKKYGLSGSKVLYSIGKKIGYTNGSLMEYPVYGGVNNEEFLKFLKYIVYYIGAVCSGSIDYKVDVNNKRIEFTMEDYIVCRKNGLGYLFSSGGVAGMWAYMMGDNSIEAVKTSWQGRRDKLCKVISEPKNALKSHNLAYMDEENLPKLDLKKEYWEFNAIKATTYSKKSLRDLINSNIFSYSKGCILYKRERYFLLEAYAIYLMEKELEGIEDGNQILFGIAFDYAQKLIKDNKELRSLNFVNDFLVATGWGDLLITKKEGVFNILIKSFPWADFKDPRFFLFRGLVSGFVSEVSGNKVIFERFDISLTKDSFNVTLKS